MDIFELPEMRLTALTPNIFCDMVDRRFCGILWRIDLCRDGSHYPVTGGYYKILVTHAILRLHLQ